MQMRPTLLSSCAKATTAAEARFRIDAAIVPSRAARVIALDPAAATVIRRVAGRQWASARFFTFESSTTSEGAADVHLRHLDGVEADLNEQLSGVDVAVMVATVGADAGADGAAAAAIGAACRVRGIMTAGLILSDDYEINSVVSALRPYARVLLVSADENDVVDVLTALRA